MLDGMPLLVGVLVADENLRAALTKLIEQAGHRVVMPEQSDVILSDSKQASTSPPTIVLSDEISPAENRLAREPHPRQLDAALRAVTAGLAFRIDRSTARRGFEEVADWPAQGILTPRELDVIDAISGGAQQQGHCARARDFAPHRQISHRVTAAKTRRAHTRRGSRKSHGETQKGNGRAVEVLPSPCKCVAVPKE